MGQANKRPYTCLKCGAEEMGQPNRARPCKTCADGTVMVRSFIAERERKPLGRKFRNRTKRIQWNRKPKQNGTVRYTLLNGDYHWVVSVRANLPRKQIAKLLWVARRKLRELMRNDVVCVGGMN